MLHDLHISYLDMKNTHQIVHVRRAVPTAVPIKIWVSWDVTPHQLL